MIIPEITLYNYISNALDGIRKDFNENPQEETLLYKFFTKQDETEYPNKIGNFDFFTQAKRLIIDNYKNHDPRSIELRLYFDRERADMPTIHINLPAETVGSIDGIGVNADSDNVDYNDRRQDWALMLSRSNDCQYNLICTSDNPFEVILMYNLLKAIFISTLPVVELHGLKNCKLSGQDLNIYSELVPANIHIRAFALSFIYETTVPETFRSKLIKFVNFSGTMKSDN